MVRQSTLEPLAALVQRLGVMVKAGVTPASAWSYLAEDLNPELATATVPIELATATVQIELATATVRINEKIGAGETIGGAIAEVANSSPSTIRMAWRGLAAAWLVAAEAGAPLAPTLADFAATLRSLAQTERELRTALAAPAATARLVMVLPVVGILFGVALGFDVLVTLFTTLPGLVCLALGSLLMLCARLWNSRLIRRATPADLTPGLTLDLIAIAVAGGLSVERSQTLVAHVADRCELTRSTAGDAATIDSILRLSMRAGVPAGVLLRSEAAEARRRAESVARRKAETLSVTLMLPLGLCVLPAFMLLGVAPLMIAVILQTVAPL